MPSPFSPEVSFLLFSRQPCCASRLPLPPRASSLCPENVFASLYSAQRYYRDSSFALRRLCVLSLAAARVPSIRFARLIPDAARIICVPTRRLYSRLLDGFRFATSWTAENLSSQFSRSRVNRVRWKRLVFILHRKQCFP